MKTASHPAYKDTFRGGSVATSCIRCEIPAPVRSMTTPELPIGNVISVTFVAAASARLGNDVTAYRNFSANKGCLLQGVSFVSACTHVWILKNKTPVIDKYLDSRRNPCPYKLEDRVENPCVSINTRCDTQTPRLTNVFAAAAEGWV